MKIDINSLIKTAMKSKDEDRLNILRLLKSAFVSAEKVDGKELDGAAEIKIIQKMISDCKNDAEIYIKVGRIEQSEDELKQATILGELLPKLPTTEDVINVVNDIIIEHFEVGHKVTMADMKDIKPLVLAKLPLANGKDIATAVKMRVGS